MSWTTKLFSTGLCQASWDRRTTTSSYKPKVHPEKKTDQRKTFQINHTSRVHKQDETLQTLCRRKSLILLAAYLPYETRACCFTAWGSEAGTTLILSLEQGLWHHPNPGIAPNHRTQTKEVNSNQSLRLYTPVFHSVAIIITQQHSNCSQQVQASLQLQISTELVNL